MRYGYKPTDAARLAIDTIAQYYPDFSGAVVVIDMHGHYGAACHGIDKFPYSVANTKNEKVSVEYIDCTKS